MIQNFKGYLKDKVFMELLIGSFILLAISLVINYFAGSYANAKISNPVTDLILDNVRVYNVDDWFVYGGYFLVVCIAVVCFLHPRRMPFTIKSIALLFLIRSVFVSLTHIAPFPTRVAIDQASLMRFFNFDGELFFSGHTGLPFLMALVFWDIKWIRFSFIGLSVFFGAIVLMGHLHYSIDVFSAFFITYAIYGLSEQLFKKDKQMGHAPRLDMSE